MVKKSIPEKKIPSNSKKEEEKNKKAVQLLSGERNIRHDNLCMTYQDVIGDAAKPSGGGTNPMQPLFQSALLRLTEKNDEICSFNYSDSIRNFITAQTVYLKHMGTIKKKQRKLIRIPFGQQTESGRTVIPLVVGSNPEEVIIDFNEDNVEISEDMMEEYRTPGEGDDVVLQRIKSQIKTTVEGSFKNYVRDNSGVPPLPESYTMSSLYDDASRTISCGRNNLSQWLNSKYPLGRWNLDLYSNGLTSIEHSSLTAEWLVQGGQGIEIPHGATSLLPGGQRNFELLRNQILFTLKLGNNFVGCIFTFSETPAETVGYTYSNAGAGSSKTPVFYYFPTTPVGIDIGSITTFILACFSGNRIKNIWFNANREYNYEPYITFGSFIQEGKAVGDASFAFTCDARSQILGSNDFGTTARALLQLVPVCYRTYIPVAGVGENVYVAIVPLRAENKNKFEKITNKTNITQRQRQEKRKYKEKIITMLGEKLKTRPTRISIRPNRLTFSHWGGTLTNIATSYSPKPEDTEDVEHAKDAAAASDAPTLIDAISSPVTLPLPDALVTPHDANPPLDAHTKTVDNSDDDNYDTEDDVEDADYNPSDDIIDYLSILLKPKIEELKAFSEYLKSVNEQLTEINNKITTTYTLDGVPIKVNPKTFNVEKKILTIEIVNKFIEKFIETPIDSLVEIIITSYIVKNGEIPSDVELVNMFSGLIQYNLFVINENTNFLSSLPSYYFIYGFYNLYLFLMNGSYTDENEVTKKFSDDNMFDPLITAANESKCNLNKYFADTDSKFKELSLPNTEISNSIESIGKIVGNLTLLIKNFFENQKYESKKSDHETTISVINILRTKLEKEEIKKQQFYQELSFNLYILSSAINMNTLSFMIVHSVMIEYSRNRDYNDTELSQCITNQLITITSPQGTSIFDLEIVITFVVSMSYSDERWSISYPKGFEGLYTLITIKKFIDGESLEFLNDNRLSLQEIGDLVDRLAFEAENQNLSDDVIKKSIKKKYEEIEAFQKLQGEKSTSSLAADTRTKILAGRGGGKNNRISNPKHNTKYRKNYKKFVSKYIIKKNKNNKKNNKNNNKNNKNNKKNKKNNKNKTKKNKRLTKSTSNSKRNNKTLKNKKGKSKSKSNNHKSKYNKKTKTNYYNSYRHNKTLKH